MDVRIYTTQGCPFCEMAKAFLNNRGVEYEEKDITMNENAAIEMIEKSGQMGVPVIEIEGNIIIGFNRNKMDRVLNVLKTVNY